VPEGSHLGVETVSVCALFVEDLLHRLLNMMDILQRRSHAVVSQVPGMSGTLIMCTGMMMMA